jgi:oxygen-independent coproporphyrinogen-3 oxidase
VPLAKALRRGEVHLPPDEDVVAMQRAVRDAYEAAGLSRYEISNYARRGLHSRHNALYWTAGEYLALGVGATGTVQLAGERLRYSNHRSAEVYLRALAQGQLAEASREVLSPLEQFEERVAMGLRLVTGVDLEAVCADFGQPFASRRATVNHLVKAGLANETLGRLRLTDGGLDLHSAISARLM